MDPVDPNDPNQEYYQGGRAWDISDDGERICEWITINKGTLDGNMWYPAIWASSENYVSTPVYEPTYWIY